MWLVKFKDAKGVVASGTKRDSHLERSRRIKGWTIDDREGEWGCEHLNGAF